MHGAILTFKLNTPAWLLSQSGRCAQRHYLITENKTFLGRFGEEQPDIGNARKASHTVMNKTWILISEHAQKGTYFLQETWLCSSFYNKEQDGETDVWWKLTFPTYCASGPMCSSKTKNWFQIQPRLGLWCTSVSPLASLVWFLEGTLVGTWWLAP